MRTPTRYVLVGSMILTPTDMSKKRRSTSCSTPRTRPSQLEPTDASRSNRSVRLLWTEPETGHTARELLNACIRLDSHFTHRMKLSLALLVSPPSSPLQPSPFPPLFLSLLPSPFFPLLASPFPLLHLPPRPPLAGPLTQRASFCSSSSESSSTGTTIPDVSTTHRTARVCTSRDLVPRSATSVPRIVYQVCTTRDRVPLYATPVPCTLCS